MSDFTIADLSQGIFVPSGGSQSLSVLSHGFILQGAALDLTGLDIKRAAELYLCFQLSAALPDINFQPFTGGSDTDDAVELEPPFTVVAVSAANKVMETEGTWQCQGTVQIITYQSEATSNAHSKMVRSVYAALADLEPDSTDPLFSFHGIDVGQMRSAQDQALKAFADICDFTCGVGG